ncbi:MAG TPA: SDR family NAD(P)-dependent oxidoreductase [Nitrospirales bacterium]|nr:SDR family NAD(P)-dependent oxidoreductase [Nitrospirales bacterium]
MPADPTAARRERWALVTGASRGIGAAYARRLAALGYGVLLIARDRERLEAVAAELTRRHKTPVLIDTLDLSLSDAAHRLYAMTRDHGVVPDILINNAGFGLYGPFVDLPMVRIQAMLRVHINTVVETTRLFLPSMIERRSGAIINVASTAGFVPAPFLTEYGATKAFLIRFSEALAEEVRVHGIRVQACCPDTTTETDFHATANFHVFNPLGASTATRVAERSLDALAHDRVVVTMGWRGAAVDLLGRWAPRRWLARRAGRWLAPSPPGGSGHDRS